MKFVFNFQARFAPDVESGAKHQTIRAMRKDGRLPKVGDDVVCYTGMRTRYCRHLRTSPCIKVRRIRFNLDTGALYLGSVRLQGAELDLFAHMDGFACFEQMLNWFRDHHRNGMFVGFLTVWEPK